MAGAEILPKGSPVERPCAEISDRDLLHRSFQEISRKDLVQRSVLETLYIEISYRDLAQGYPTAMLPKAFLESLCREIQRPCIEISCTDLATRSLTEILPRDLLSRA